ncbi:signal peptidase II [Butyrivibrio sp. VCD2006]|uniref:signal peptidase II n=1 Tax=Butyrivibrio sp. VCD2006 TaxID=1280664 RepID=UPI0004159C4A|nr:signal peptidase II [Butyrivibrio sp. VCD2006]
MNNFNTKKKIHLIIDLISILVLIAIDQFTKLLAVEKLQDQDSVVLIKGVLELTFLKNYGAAFGILQNQKIFFVMIAIMIIVVIAYILFQLPLEKKYTILQIILVMIAGGAAGNMIDRVRNDYVVDFISFVIINFPIFNVADIYVTVSTILFIILFLFYYKEKDFDFLSFKQQKKYREFK